MVQTASMYSRSSSVKRCRSGSLGSFSIVILLSPRRAASTWRIPNCRVSNEHLTVGIEVAVGIRVPPVSLDSLRPEVSSQARNDTVFIRACRITNRISVSVSFHRGESFLYGKRVRKSKMEGKQSIEVPFTPGDTVTLVGGGEVILEDTLDRHVPKLGLLEFENNDVGMHAFKDMLEACEGMHVVKGK